MTEGLLPEAVDQASYMEASSRSDFVPAAAEICRRHGIPSSGPVRVDSGTHLVFLLDGMAIKLYAPPWPEDFRAERAALAGKAPVPDGAAFEDALFGFRLD